MEEKLAAEFKDLEVVSRRPNSMVYKGKHQDSPKTYAIKLLKAETDELYDNLINELTIQKKLTHPNILSIDNFEGNREQRQVYYTMPYLRSLREIISNRSQRPDLKEVLTLLKDITSALQYAKNTVNIAHSHIKPENIFCLDNTCSHVLAGWCGHPSSRKNNSSVRKSTIKLGDNTTKPGDYKKNVPNSIYEAPETKMSLDAVSKASVSNYKTADIYSLGVVMLEFCGIEQYRLGKCGVAGEESKTVLEEIQKDLLSWYSNKKVVGTLLKMVQRWSVDRPSAYEILLQVELISSAIFGYDKDTTMDGDTLMPPLQKVGQIISGESYKSASNILDQSSETSLSEHTQNINDTLMKKPKATDPEELDLSKAQPAKRNLIFSTDNTPKNRMTQEDLRLLTENLMTISYRTGGNETTIKLETQDADESKDGEEKIVVRKKKLTQPPSNTNSGSKLVLLSKEEAIRAQNQQRKQSGFASFIDSVGVGISDFGKTALNFGAKVGEGLVDVGKKALNESEDAIGTFGKKALEKIETHISIFGSKKDPLRIDISRELTIGESPLLDRVLSPSKVIQKISCLLPFELRGSNSDEQKTEFATNNLPRRSQKKLGVCRRFRR